MIKECEHGHAKWSCSTCVELAKLREQRARVTAERDQYYLDAMRWTEQEHEARRRLGLGESLYQAIAPLVGEWRFQPKFDDDVWRKRQRVVEAFDAASLPAKPSGGEP